jgi:putative restriction endonuclease
VDCPVEANRRETATVKTEDLAAEFLDRIRAIKPWKRRDERAPHKPLLLLLILARIQRGEEDPVEYGEVEEPLRELLQEYGPPRLSQHPEYPFWYLQNDGLWMLDGTAGLPTKPGKASLPPAVLRLERIRGRLRNEYLDLLRVSPELLGQAAHLILEEHFPASYHDELLTAVGLDIDAADGLALIGRRSPEFRRLILIAYERQCAVCGYDCALDGVPLGLQAAHVRWHKQRGPDIVENGLCLCPTHHLALDKGALGLSEDHRILISQRVHGTDARIAEALLRFSGQPLRGPQEGQAMIDGRFIEWHRRQVFRAPARPAAAA